MISRPDPERASNAETQLREFEALLVAAEVASNIIRFPVELVRPPEPREIVA